MLMDEIQRSFDAVSVSNQRVHAFREQFHIIRIREINFCALFESRRKGSEGVDFSAFAQRTSGCRLKWPIFLRIVAMGPVSPLDLRLRPPDRSPALTTGGRRKNMSRESSKSMKIGLKFEWEIEPRERFAQNPPKFVFIRRAGLTFPKHCQAGSPNGHVESCAPGVVAPFNRR